MRIPLPQQISSVPAIDNGAMGWAGSLVDGLGRIRISELIFGFATLTWPGVGTISNALQVTHGLTKQAAGQAKLGAVFTQVDALAIPGLNNPPVIAINAGASAQQFQAAGYTIDGQVPANTATTGFYWVAMI